VSKLIEIQYADKVRSFVPVAAFPASAAENLYKSSHLPPDFCANRKRGVLAAFWCIRGARLPVPIINIKRSATDASM
jgi:hypothetical protein